MLNKVPYVSIEKVLKMIIWAKIFIFEPNKIQNTLTRFDIQINLREFSEVDLNIETRQNILDFVWLKNKYFSTNDHFQDIFNHDYLAKLFPPPIIPYVSCRYLRNFEDTEKVH